jgi:hypothetical protein
MACLPRISLEHCIPLNVHFDFTCCRNERCLHCYLERPDLGEISAVDVFDILYQLASAGSLLLTFGGGDVFETLGYARLLHFDLSLKTNRILIEWHARKPKAHQFKLRTSEIVQRCSGLANLEDGDVLGPPSEIVIWPKSKQGLLECLAQ